MSPDRETQEVPAVRGLPSLAVGRAWLLFVDGLAAVGTVLIFVLMVIICADIVARNGLGASLPLVSELGALLLVMIVSLQLATTIRADRLARTEVFYLNLRQSFPRLGALVSAVFDVVGAGVMGGIAWSSSWILQKDWTSGEYIGVTGVMTLPTWPFRTLVLLGVTVAAIQFVVRAVEEVQFAVRGGGKT
jgi:TRAP-type mannitol/chloroaromatic compound transport system permease small subunit